MASSISKRMLATLVVALLACALCMLALAPRSAQAVQSADETSTVQASQVDGASVAQASGKKTIYVRVSKGDTKYAYNKHGLVTKLTEKSGTSTFKTKFKYSGKKLVKAVHKRDGSEDMRWSIKYDSKGRVKKIVTVSPMAVDLYNNTETYYYNSKNQVKKKVTSNKISGTKDVVKYYYNAKGLVKKIVMSTGTDIIKYDKKGNPISWLRKYPAGSDFKDSQTYYKNTYKKGRLASVKLTDKSGFGYPQKIKYVKKSVPKKYAATVKAQQKELRVTVPGSVLSLLS